MVHCDSIRCHGIDVYVEMSELIMALGKFARRIGETKILLSIRLLIIQYA